MRLFAPICDNLRQFDLHRFGDCFSCRRVRLREPGEGCERFLPGGGAGGGAGADKGGAEGGKAVGEGAPLHGAETATHSQQALRQRRLHLPVHWRRTRSLQPQLRRLATRRRRRPARSGGDHLGQNGHQSSSRI